MIKLKLLLTESEVPITDPFTLGDTDPYEYYYNEKDKTWYTKLKTAQKWKPMKTVASNFDLAIKRITSGPRYPTRKVIDKTKDSEVISNNDQIKEPGKKDSESANEKSRLSKIFNMQVKIMDYLKDQLTDNPANYFKKFKSKVNDKELELYYWWYKDTYIFYKKAIAKSRDTAYDPILKSNFDIVEQCLDIIAKQFKEGGSDWSFDTELQDPITKKLKSYKIVWNYLKW